MILGPFTYSPLTLRLAPEQFYRLRSAGLFVGHNPQTARPRCGLYGTYLREHL
jgi:hypothetical protein